MTSQGVLYVAKEPDYVDEATLSARSVRDQMPDVPIGLITRPDADADVFDIVIERDDLRGDFGDAVHQFHRTPFDRTILFDTDIYCCEPIDDVFEVLDAFDIAAAHAPFRHATGRVTIPEVEDVPLVFPEYQGGVIAYADTDRVASFHDRWLGAYQSTLERGWHSDQASFRAALYHSDCRVATLPPEYNCLVRMPNAVTGPVKVIHNRLLDIDGDGAVKLIDTDRAVDTINQRADRRVFYRSGNRIKFAEPNLLMQVRDSIIRDGWRATAEKVVGRLLPG